MRKATTLAVTMLLAVLLTAFPASAQDPSPQADLAQATDTPQAAPQSAGTQAASGQYAQDTGTAQEGSVQVTFRLHVEGQVTEYSNITLSRLPHGQATDASFCTTFPEYVQQGQPGCQSGGAYDSNPALEVLAGQPVSYEIVRSTFPGDGTDGQYETIASGTRTFTQDTTVDVYYTAPASDGTTASGDGQAPANQSGDTTGAQTGSDNGGTAATENSAASGATDSNGATGSNSATTTSAGTTAGADTSGESGSPETAAPDASAGSGSGGSVSGAPPLPETGGVVPAVLAGGLLLAGAGLVVRRITR